MSEPEVTLEIDGTGVTVSGSSIREDRSARLFFDTVLGAEPRSDGWRCPRRKGSMQSLVVRINTYLESRGWTCRRIGEADSAILREIERQRSFNRTREAATNFRQGQVSVPWEQVAETLRNAGWNESARKLLPHQRQGVLHALTAANAANFSVPGSGKTAIALATAVAHVASGTVDLVLVVGPLACFAPWEREVQVAMNGRMAVRRIRGSSSTRRGGYDSAMKGELLLVSYASAASDKDALIELCRTHKVMLIADESHRIKRFRGGLWAPAIIEVANAARVRMILSGTPMPQSGKDLYSQLNVLWPGGDLTGPRDDFAFRAERHFAALLADVQPFVSRTAKETLGLPPYTVVRHDVPLMGTQAEVYDLIESHFRRQIEGATNWQQKLDALRRGRPIRLLQAATNPDLLNGPDTFYRLPRLEGGSATLLDRLGAYRGLEIPAKCAAALTLLREMSARGEKVVCWSNFVPNLDFFSRFISTELQIPCFQIDGRTPTEDESPTGSQQQLSFDEVETRELIIDKFLSCVGPAVLVTNPASCSESISLHSACHRALYLDRTYDCALFLQSIDRIHRLGLAHNVKVEIHILLATYSGRGTIDHLVDQSLLQKESRMKQLLEGAELRAIALSEDPLTAAQGDEEDLAALLRFLLGEGERRGVQS